MAAGPTADGSRTVTCTVARLVPFQYGSPLRKDSRPMSPVNDHDATIGERLRALRLWRHMTLAEVAGLAGVSAAYLSMAERGLRSIDRRSLISALAAALRVSETHLTGGPPPPGAAPHQAAPPHALPPLRGSPA